MPVLLRSRVILFTNVGVHVARRMTTIPHQPFRAEGFKKKKGFQSGDCSDSSAVGMKRVSHISAYDFRWLESTGMSNITLKSTCCEQTEWQFHPLRLIYGSSDFFKISFYHCCFTACVHRINVTHTTARLVYSARCDYSSASLWI